MSDIQEIGYVDEASMWVHVPASVSVRQVEERLRGKGLTLGPQPPSVLRGTVRGWIEGPWAGRWVEGGRLATCVVSLRATLDDGNILRTVAAPRTAAGPGLGQLFCGSGGRFGEVGWVALRARPLSKRSERRSFAGPRDAVARWLRGEAARISPPLEAEVVGGDPLVACLLFPADTELERMRGEAAADAARKLGLQEVEAPGRGASSPPWEGELPGSMWRQALEGLVAGARLSLVRIARESAVAVTTAAVGEALPRPLRQDPLLDALEDAVAARLRPH